MGVLTEKERALSRNQGPRNQEPFPRSGRPQPERTTDGSFLPVSAHSPRWKKD
ncbi:hypothetical protein [Pseudoxanthomonas wuyuanensis]|uniref:hypothetical protein n=1 Tax=Pseudoxanthomonas wuyuanensis TaxID=1073196 RepID=UPI001389D180|nr:hypothetical protein [Pseudoxanthomonas wuyuanensis]